MEARFVFLQAHTSPAGAWDARPWSADSELRCARGVAIGSVPRGSALFVTYSCVPVSVKPVYDLCHIMHLMEDNGGNA